MKKIYPFLTLCAIILECKFQRTDNTLEYENVINEDGYHFRYKTEDSERAETGVFDNIRGLVVKGFYEFVGTDGNTYHVEYEADENGYRPQVATRSGPGIMPQIPQLPSRMRSEPSLFLSSAALASLTGGGLG
nr:PREDICTED: larval cuticle protein 8 [Tribolium castaneum]|eukprot:XP_015836169.1 PREDICTED: larval cuticle protein 8 [Tribolium castaneum]